MRNSSSQKIAADDDGDGDAAASLDASVDSDTSNALESGPGRPATGLSSDGEAQTAQHQPGTMLESTDVATENSTTAENGKNGSIAAGEESSAQRRLRKRPNERYLLVMNVAEGMTSWYHALYEMMDLARRLGRTIVEPCVRDGRIVTCVPGKVHAVPFGVDDAPAGSVTAESDPLALRSLTCQTQASGDPASSPGSDNDGGGAGKRKKKKRRRGGPGHKRRAAFNADVRRQMSALQSALQVSPDGWAYPLHAYVDMAHLRQLYRYWVSFEDWLAIEQGAQDCAITRVGEALMLPLGYCVGKTGEDVERLCDSPAGNVDLRPWAFRKMVTRWQVPVAKAPTAGGRPETQHLKHNLKHLRADGTRSVFLFNVWRGAFDPVDTYDQLPPFNPVHAAAVTAWLARSIAPDPAFPGAAARGFGRYVAWQWRSETVKQDIHFKACAIKLAMVAKEAMRPLKRDRARAALLKGNVSIAALQSKGGFDTRKGNGPPAPRVSVLVADIPAPNNRCRLWGQYEQSFDGMAQRAVAKMMAPSVGMLKYDGDHPGLDAGVLAIRDFLVALEADWFVTCRGRNGAECLGCFRATSYFSKKLGDMRAARGKGSLFNWFGVAPNDLQA